MVKSWAMGSLLALAAIPSARATCDDLVNYLNVPSPLTEDTTITLTVDTIECEQLDADDNVMEVEQIVVEGATLTIASDNTVQFINVAFSVESGAALVFDMPETVFGPNDDSTEDNPNGSLLEVEDGASLTFNGDVTIQEIEIVDRIIRNYGTIEFKGTTLIENNINGVPDNTGTLTFVGDTIIQGNDGIGIQNEDGGVVRFEAAATFEDNGSSLDGFSGCDIENLGSESEMSFEGTATFQNTNCRSSEGTSLYNNGVMTFNGKARFNNNVARDNGGAVRNNLGSMTFARAVQFNNNDASGYGGGIAVDGGDVTFSKAVLFSGNSAESGGAFSIQYAETSSNGVVTDSSFGSLTFEKPSKVTFEDNTADSDDDDENCTVGEVEEGATLIGYPDDDVCVAA